MLVDNEPGVLARIVGLFSGRGYNIDSLTVSETEHDKHLSRFTIVTTGTPHGARPRSSTSSSAWCPCTGRRPHGAGQAAGARACAGQGGGKGDKRIEALRLADIFRANVIDASTEHFVFEITGSTYKIEQFISIMMALGLVEVSRTGVAAIARGPEGM